MTGIRNDDPPHTEHRMRHVNVNTIASNSINIAKIIIEDPNQRQIYRFVFESQSKKQMEKMRTGKLTKTREQHPVSENKCENKCSGKISHYRLASYIPNKR